MAEVLFQDGQLAPIAARQFNGASADGQIIQAEVTKVQSIPSISSTPVGYMPMAASQDGYKQ